MQLYQTFSQSIPFSAILMAASKAMIQFCKNCNLFCQAKQAVTHTMRYTETHTGNVIQRRHNHRGNCKEVDLCVILSKRNTIKACPFIH